MPYIAVPCSTLEYLVSNLAVPCRTVHYLCCTYSTLQYPTEQGSTLQISAITLENHAAPFQYTSTLQYLIIPNLITLTCLTFDLVVILILKMNVSVAWQTE